MITKESKREVKKMANRTVIVRDVEKLKELIVKSGFSYRQLAKEAYCSQTQISMILKGERNPSPSNAVNICKALGCYFDDIFFIKFDCKRNQKVRNVM